MIKYKDGFRYQLDEDYKVTVGFSPDKDIGTHFIDFRTSGILTIKKGYAWDGPSGPTIDTANFMRGSLIHDALYQLMRFGHLSMAYRELADDELKRVCLQDGMSKARAWYVHWALRRGGRKAALPSSTKKIYRAP